MSKPITIPQHSLKSQLPPSNQTDQVHKTQTHYSSLKLAKSYFPLSKHRLDSVHNPNTQPFNLNKTNFHHKTVKPCPQSSTHYTLLLSQNNNHNQHITHYSLLKLAKSYSALSKIRIPSRFSAQSNHTP